MWCQVPEVDTAVRSLTVMWDGSLVVAANNHGTCYVWRLLRGTQVVPKCRMLIIVQLTIQIVWLLFLFQTMTNFEPLHKLQAHKGYILKCLLSPEFCEPHRSCSSDLMHSLFFPFFLFHNLDAFANCNTWFHIF